MRIALFSDIHANLPALEAVLTDIDDRDVDAVYCLGDLVGYATWPNEVVTTIRARGIPTIAGNYDEGVGLASDDCGCAYKTDDDRARGALSIAYTNRTVTDSVRDYLRRLPRHMRLTCLEGRLADARPLDVLLVHGSPRRINEYLFEDRPEKSVSRLFAESGADVIVCGHTHKPYHRKLARGDDGGFNHLVNIGSVGKPKDGDPRACYAILDVDPSVSPERDGRIRAEFVRVGYDVERAAVAIEQSELPDAFADMLRRAY
ncbi:MAG: metallophosphoesterase family protein [Rhodothermales bacterium]|nr:metallophosphoesterase family protein [Rhodothermales bacterium]